MDREKKFFCPRLLDYIVIVGSRNPNSNNHVAQTPELLRRYPLEDHKDFPLPTDVIFFCQPEGCIVVGPKRMSLRESTSFVFTLTEKDSGISRYGICVNFFRPFEKRSHGSSEWQKVERTSFGSVTSAETSSSLEMDRPRSPRLKKKSRSSSRVRNNTLTSLCIVSHHPFFSTFRECLSILRRLIEACHDRSCVKRIGGSKGAPRDTVWGVLTGQCSENITSLVMHEVREIETWILRLLSAPVPVPGKTRVEVSVLPHEMQAPLMFALPDNTRFQLVDFPLHLPLELLGVETCLRVLTAIMLEHKVILQSRDYNALSMSVMAFVAMLYPLEYMFPVIPLLPTCMAAAEQLLLAPTPYLIGVPASFFLYKKDFKMPDDIWLVDLDSNKINPPPGSGVEILPPLPEPEGQCLKTHLKQALASMSMTPQPIKNLDAIAQNPEVWQRRESFSSQTGFNPLIYGNDVDSVDVATRVAMIRFFNSPNILGNFTEHTRTLRLYPRPVVAFQLYSFLKSRPSKTHFTARLARTQAVEYYAEWSLCPTNMVYLRVQTAVYDPSLIGDKPKWYAHQLQRVEFHVYDESSSLGAAITSVSEVHSDEVPTDESGSDSEGAESTSSSYSSLSDFVTDMVNSEIDGETPAFLRENQVLAVDESKVFCPPSKLHVPDEGTTTQSESTILIPESSDLSSSESSSPTYSHDSPRPDRGVDARDQEEDEQIFRYDSGHVTATSQSSSSRAGSLSQGSTPVQPDPTRKPSGPMGPPPYGNPASFGTAPPYGNPPYGNPPFGTGAPPYGNPPQAYGVPPSAFEPFEKSPRSSLLPPPPGRTLSHPGSRGSGSSAGSSSSTKKAFRALSDQGSDRSSTPSSIISTISNELTDMAHSATSNLSELFGTKQAPASTPPVSKPAKPFTPLGTRKALVEKSGLVKHATNRKPKEPPKPPTSDTRGSTNSENQQFLKEVISGILEGQGLSWLKLNRVKKLMEDENYRNFVVSRLNRNLDKKLGDAEAMFIEDVCISKQVFRGMLTMMKAMIYGLEFTYRNHGLGGMASAFVLLEIIHTHYWAREANRSETSLTPDMASLHGSHESLGSKEGDATAAGDPLGAREDPVVHCEVQEITSSPVIVNGDEFENIEMPPSEGHHDFDSPVGGHPGHPGGHPGGHPPLPDMNRNIEKQGGAPHCDIVVTEAGERDGDLLRQILTNKDAMRSAGRQLDKRFSSIDSEVSEASTLVSSSSDNNEEKRRARINHHSIRTALSDSEADHPAALKFGKRSRSPSVWSSKSNLSTGFRYHEGRMISVCKQTNADIHKTYLFEGLIGKDRSPLWDQMQFWEDVYLDAVAQERDIIGMDQRPSEMMERYMSLGEVERKRLEHDEDKLLSLMLYDLVSFMVMMGVNKAEIKKKIRRLLGKSHIGLAYSQEVNTLLDHISNLHGNDIDLKPMGSRLMQKQSFTVHWGTDNSGDMLFMEVCDDCLLLRSVTGTIHDRWWFEKLVNMTYCPKTKVLCLWRKNGEKVQLNQFYTKKCRELYFCVKESMEKAVARSSGKLPGPELGGEFPVQDLKSGQGGLLQVCMEGIGLLLANSKFFIELSRVRKCFTQKGGIFVLEEFDPKTKQVIQHKFKSSMAIQVAFMLHRIFAVQWSRFLESRSHKARLDQNHNS